MHSCLNCMDCLEVKEGISRVSYCQKCFESIMDPINGPQSQEAATMRRQMQAGLKAIWDSQYCELMGTA